LIPALVVAVAGFSTAHADPPAKTSPFGTKSYGEGGGYKHPDAAVGDFFETKPQSPAEAKPERAKIPAKITPEIKPVAAIPSRPRPRPFAPAKEKAKDASASLAAAKAAAPEKTQPAPAASAATVQGGDDSASEDARRDYEARLFGAAPAPRRPGLADSQAIPSTDPALSASTGEGMLFVSLELDAKEAGSLRDAVAGLGSAAAFRPDARFQPLPGEGGSVRISGWLPASRLGDAIARPGVKRVAVERGSRPAGDNRVTGEYLLKMRVTDASHPEESIAASVRELTAETGFKLDRVFGFETVPGGDASALVSGTMPVSQLSRALGLAGVIKVGYSLSAVDSPAAPAAPVQKDGFLKFVMARSLWLVLLTALLALPAFGRGLKSALAVFVPYR
jgi:hypothetical protein